MNGSADNLSDNDNWTWTSKSTEVVMWRNCTNCAAVRDPGVELLRHIIEVWLTMPIVLLGIAGNVVAFFVLCHHRRHKLQTTTAILQVIHSHRTSLRDALAISCINDVQSIINRKFSGTVAVHRFPLRR